MSRLCLLVLAVHVRSAQASDDGQAAQQWAATATRHQNDQIAIDMLAGPITASAPSCADECLADLDAELDLCEQTSTADTIATCTEAADDNYQCCMDSCDP